MLDWYADNIQTLKCREFTFMLVELDLLPYSFSYFFFSITLYLKKIHMKLFRFMNTPLSTVCLE